MNKLAIQLRKTITDIRTRPYPIKDLIPLLQQAADQLDRLEKENTNMSWTINPDRMGGAYSEDEVRNAYEWK